jgi:hypothetical protein
MSIETEILRGSNDIFVIKECCHWMINCFSEFQNTTKDGGEIRILFMMEKKKPEYQTKQQKKS